MHFYFIRLKSSFGKFSKGQEVSAFNWDQRCFKKGAIRVLTLLVPKGFELFLRTVDKCSEVLQHAKAHHDKNQQF